MAFSDLCQISNAFKAVENESDQSDRFMEENSIVQELITKILDDTGTNEKDGPAPADKPVPTTQSTPTTTTSTYSEPTSSYFYQNSFNYSPTLEQSSFGFGYNGFYSDEVLPIDPLVDDPVTPEQLNLLRLAAQEIGGAQFTSPNNDKFFNYEPRNVPEYYNRAPNENSWCYQNYPKEQDSDVLTYLNQLSISLERREETEYKYDVPYQNEEFKGADSKFFGRGYPGKFDGQYYEQDYYKTGQPGNCGNQGNQGNQLFKPNGYQGYRGYHGNGDRFDTPPREQFRPAQEVRPMVVMRPRPPSQLNVDVSFLHENAPFNIGLGALLGPSPPVPQAVLPSPLLDMPLTPYHAMRSLRQPASASSVLHARLDACYEQWRQLERERKRTEARLALAYPGRAVSSSNSIPVPRLPPCPTRVDRLTVDMLREHTKVLTLMGKMETLRASVCVAQTKKTDTRITVLRRGQENVSPEGFEPSSWREDVAGMSEIAPHSEVEGAMLAWRNAVAGVQAARRRELAPHPRHPRADPIMHLADAVKQLCICARRARCAMWCDLTLTVALAPPNSPPPSVASAKNEISNQLSSQSASPKQNATDNVSTSNAMVNKNNGAEIKEEKQSQPSPSTATRDAKENNNNNNTNNANNNNNNITNNNNRQQNKQPERQDKNQQRRTQNYRHKLNQGRSDFYPKNRYDNRFMNRHPYHYLATGPIN